MATILSKIFQSSTNSGKESASVKLPSEIQGIDKNADGVVDKDELQVYIDQNAQLWAMLSVNCNIPEEDCRQIARDTARTMAKLNTLGPTATFQDLTPLNAAREPTVDEFAAFHQRLQNDPHYTSEFFHQTVFCAYDHDQNGYIEGDEINDFIDLFYEANGCFAGDARLPPKDHLRAAVLETFDTNGDGKLEFHELRPLISGGASGFTKDLGPSAEWPDLPKQQSKSATVTATEHTKTKGNPQEGDSSKTTTTTSKASSSSAKKKALKKERSERKLRKKEKSDRKLKKEVSDRKLSSKEGSDAKVKVKRSNSDPKVKRSNSDPKVKRSNSDQKMKKDLEKRKTTDKASDKRSKGSSDKYTTTIDKKSLKKKSSRNRSPSKTRSRSQSKTRTRSTTRSKSRPSRRRASTNKE